MRFEVPQFIDVEDKIFGPLTFKQFVYLLGGAGLGYASYKIIPFPFWIIATAAFVGIALALAFYKLNNRPFIEIAQSWMTYNLRGKRFIWKRDIRPRQDAQPVVVQQTVVPKMQDITAERVATLAQNLDIMDAQQ